MKEPLDYGGAWKRLRYAWKKALIAHPEQLSRGAKLLATQMCDSYANSKTGCCWARNETLALHQGVEIRTIQRHVRELIDAGWIKRVRIPGRKRVLQLVFPPGWQGDEEGDIQPRANATVLALKHDRSVTSYREHKNNLRDDREPACHSVPLSWVSVNENEHPSIEAWEEWITQNMPGDPSEVLNQARNGLGYMLPCRFPKDGDANQAAYRKFFDNSGHS